MLHIFPPGLDGTLLVPVLVGVVVMALLSEWWGWDFVGVVVPGYLTSVLLLQPVVAAVVIVEAVLTWGVARSLDAAATRAGVAFPVFGRDRFYLILVVSLAVRMLVEAFALQPLAGRMAASWPALEAHRTELFGIGLVLVPLMANRFWNPGLRRGLWQLAVQTGLVFFVVAVVLVRLTNFSIGGFELAYDHLALAFLTSPRAQMTLIVTAALASGLNRKYGWDFHGILVPALLALAVVTPWKLCATAVEAGAVVTVVRAIAALPLFRRASIEGSRKVVLCFAVGFALKLVLAYGLAARAPGYRPSDFFGFGYLLPSLLAERIWQKRSAALVIVPTLQTSIAGIAAAAAVALALGWIAPSSVAKADESRIPRFASLPQAVATMRNDLARPGRPAIDEIVRAASAGVLAAVATTAEGYRVFVTPGIRGLCALRAGATGFVTAAPDEDPAETAARDAVRRGLGLRLGEPADTAAAAAPATAAIPPAPLPTSEHAARTLALADAADPARHIAPVPPPSAAVEAAARIARDRAQPARLGQSLSSLGLTVTRTADGGLLVAGPGWPDVVLRAEPHAVAAAARPSEVGTPAAALLAADRLGADAVIPTTDDDAAASALAVAMSESGRRPLVMVRGAAALPGGDVLVIRRPEPASGAASFIDPLLRALVPRLPSARADTGETAALRAFPSGAGRSSPAALVWLSPRARRLLVSGGDWAARPEIEKLAHARGIPVLRADAAAWLAAGTGPPPPYAVDLAERLARTRDVALLRPMRGATLALLMDEPRGLGLVAIEAGSRRALALPGDRAERRMSVVDAAEAADSLISGARTLLPAGEAQ